MQYSLSANRAWNPQAKWWIFWAQDGLGGSGVVIGSWDAVVWVKVSFKQCLLTSAIDELALMDLNEIRNVGPWVLLKGFVYEAIISWFFSLTAFAWEMAENLVELFLTQLVGKERPECLTARFPAQWVAWKDLDYSNTLLKPYRYSGKEVAHVRFLQCLVWLWIHVLLFSLAGCCG